MFAESEYVTSQKFNILHASLKDLPCVTKGSEVLIGGAEALDLSTHKRVNIMGNCWRMFL